MRDRLVIILKEEVNGIQEDMTKLEKFDKPAWSQYQAARLGEIRALKQLINLLSEE